MARENEDFKSVRGGRQGSVLVVGVAEKRGLWSMPKAIPPWGFRRSKR